MGGLLLFWWWWKFNFRNPDFREVILEKDGKVLLRFATANGFRNIQNLVQKLKRGKSLYHYVEVMACPSGSNKKMKNI